MSKTLGQGVFSWTAKSLGIVEFVQLSRLSKRNRDVGSYGNLRRAPWMRTPPERFGLDSRGHLGQAKNRQWRQSLMSTDREIFELDTLGQGGQCPGCPGCPRCPRAFRHFALSKRAGRSSRLDCPLLANSPRARNSALPGVSHPLAPERGNAGPLTRISPRSPPARQSCDQSMMLSGYSGGYTQDRAAAFHIEFAGKRQRTPSVARTAAVEIIGRPNECVRAGWRSPARPRKDPATPTPGAGFRQAPAKSTDPVQPKFFHAQNSRPLEVKP